MEYRDSKNSPITLGSLIGHGGQGAVYNVSNRRDEAVKIYHQGRVNDDTRRKIGVMVRNRPQMLANTYFWIAWPKDIVYTRQDGSMAGYLMPKIDRDEFCDIGSYFNPARREGLLRERSSGFDYRNLLEMARNLAATVEALHNGGYIIGDFNSQNVLANGDGRIALIDTDSFQVKDPASRKNYRCPVGTPEYTPRDLQGKEFSSVDRTKCHDNFALAVMIYQLLFQGRHPFDGLYLPYSGKRELPTVAEKIKEGHFVHNATDQPIYEPPEESSIIWNSLPKLLRRRFGAGLEPEPRYPQAHLWVTALTKEIERVNQCQINSLHYYFGLKWCVWCKYQKVTKYDPFPPVSGAAATGRGSIRRTPRLRKGAPRPAR